ncbi:MAG: mechanosensitive ion channel family protein [Clostridia bacterium]|nr:mechanosensitive ion channel family protein [Clostridia bacterium]
MVMKFLAAAAKAAEETTSQIALTNPDGSIISVTNPDGSLVSVSDAAETVVENVTHWWDKLDLFNRFINVLPALIVAVITVVLGFFVAKFVAKLVKKALVAKNVDPSVHTFVINVIKMLIYIVFFVSALSKFGFNITTFIAAIGAAGVTAGLGLQQSVSQFASGIQILINRPFKNGDYIEVGAYAGSVADIHLMYTVIMTVDNKRVIIPNSSITASSIINYTAEEKRRVDINFNISYSSDISKARAVILNVCDKIPSALKDPKPVVYVLSHESSSVQLVCRAWCCTSDYWDLYFDLQEKVKLAFDEAGVVIPFDQLDVNIVNK